MKKASAVGSKVREMKPEYGFSHGVRGKYAKRYAKATNIVILDPDVARVFPDSASVNAALRALTAIIRDTARRRRRKSGSR